MENIYVQFEGMVYPQIEGIPMVTNCAPLIADLFLFFYEWDYPPPPSTYDLWRAGSSPTIFQSVEKLIPLTTTSQSGSDKPLILLWEGFYV